MREISLGDWEGHPFASIKRRHPNAYRLRGEQIADYRPMLTVTYVGVIRALICRLLGVPLENLFAIGQSYGTLTIVERRPDGCVSGR